MKNPGRERLDRRHKIHERVRLTIDRWNTFKEKLHMGDRIELAAAITEAIMMDEPTPQTSAMSDTRNS